jgi:hypothetical protein
MKRHTQILSALALASFALATSAHAQTLILNLQSTNYNPTTGVWTDASASLDNATALGTAPSLVADSTPNGSSTVDFTGTLQSLTLGTPIAAGDYTIFAYILPSANQSAGGDRGAIISGGDNAFEYGIENATKYPTTGAIQNALRTSESYLGGSSTPLSTTAYSVVDVSEGVSTGGSFRLNGVDDGTLGSSGITAPLTNIGSQDSGSEFFSGDIAAIEVYSGTMTDAQRGAVEQSLIDTYATAAPEPSTWAMLFGGFALLLGVQCLHRKRGV